MIEVEKKFILSQDDINRLIQGAQFLDERSFTDVYYDTHDFSLSTENKWLRSRGGLFELKLPARQGMDLLVDQYDEIDDEEKIRAALRLPQGKSLSSALEEARYSPFCTISTLRQEYKAGPFIIDLDTADFGKFVYRVGEIELGVRERSEVSDAIQEITDFAKKKDLTIAPVRGKLVEYLKRMRPKHYQALVAANVVKDF